jgi:hypothetical protein
VEITEDAPVSTVHDRAILLGAKVGDDSVVKVHIVEKVGSFASEEKNERIETDQK